MDLLGDDSGANVDFTINEDYAKRYEKWRRGEEIQKLKDKYGDVDDSTESSSEEEDEDGKELTEDVEKQFYKALSCLKEKNPKIYDQNIRFFDQKPENNEIKEKDQKNGKIEQSLSLAGYQRKVLLETGGHFSDDEEVDEKQFEMMSSQDQEKHIKQSFKDVLKDSDDEDEEQWGNLFTKRVKTAEEINKEEEDFRQWLAGEKKIKDSEIKEELKGLHDYWTDPKLNEGEKFLRDYVLNKRYLEQEDKNRIPSYDEIVHDSDSNLSADDEALDEQEEFEKKYNFRFEEPDREFIKRYPRTLEQSMRKKDERRKTHREELKQRKETERSKKDEELKRLKALKKKEIMDKIKKLQQITGNEDIAFQTEDLEGDFDPQEYDKRMADIFNEDYYGTGGDDEYPQISEYEEDLETENWDNWEGYDGEEEQEDQLHCEDPNFNMDCDYDPTKKKKLQQELIQNSRRKKNKRKSKFAEALEREKPIFDPKDKTFEQYVDEYYALDYEDLIGDLPCRFKYRKVVPNDYGLTIDEILNADDQELNRWVSIKKIRRRNPEHIEKYDVKAYKLKASNFQKKAKCFPSLYGPKAEASEQPGIQATGGEFKNQKKNSDSLGQNCSEQQTAVSEYEARGKKKRELVTSNTELSLQSGGAVADNLEESTGESRLGSKKKNKKKRKMEDVEIGEPLNKGKAVKDEVPMNVDVTERKKKKKKQKMEDLESRGSFNKSGALEEEVAVKSGVTESKKKKKKRNFEDIEAVGLNDVEVVQEGTIVNGEAVGGKKKKKKGKINNNWITETVVNVEPVSGLNSETGKKKKRRRRKGKGGNEPKGANNVSAAQLGKKRKRGESESSQKFNQNEGKRRKKQKKNQKESESCGLSDERLRSYGLNPKKFKNKLKYKTKNK